MNVSSIMPEVLGRTKSERGAMARLARSGWSLFAFAEEEVWVVDSPPGLKKKFCNSEG